MSSYRLKWIKINNFYGFDNNIILDVLGGLNEEFS